ncbi:MAG: LysM peptidoglycan-binding domain-containing protein [Phycisphaerales bacterium JB043]
MPNTGITQRMSVGVLALACVWIVSYWLFDARDRTRGEPPSITIDQTEMYVVQAGDNLESIAERLYGDSSKWELLYEANREVLADQSSFRAGVRLIVPRVEADR